MTRRSFLNLLGVGAVAAVVAPKVLARNPNVECVYGGPPIVTPTGLRGLPYIVQNSGTWHGKLVHRADSRGMKIVL